MPKRVSTKQLLMACQMSFEGKGNREIANKIGFTETTVSNWRKLGDLARIRGGTH